MFQIRYVTTLIVLITAVAMGAVGGHAAEGKSSPAEKEAKAIGVLRSDAPAAEKAIACKQLAIYGGKEAVPALESLLPDDSLASWARIALEAMPDPAADEALRSAMGKVQGKLLVGVVNSIGVRRDAGAVERLAGRLADADVEVASAAAVALGRVGNSAAATALEKAFPTAPAGIRSAVAEGCILCAERFVAEGHRDVAAVLYDSVRKADVPKPRILEATRGAILARQSAGVPLLVEQLRSADKALFHIGLGAARELAGREVTEALVAELGRAPADRQGLLILALADRGDATALPAVIEVARSGPSEVRVVALGVLKRIGNIGCLPVLLEAAAEGDADVAKAAKAVLAEMPCQELDAELLGQLAKAEGRLRLALIEVAGQRHLREALPTLIKAADDADGQMRAIALAALGEMIELGDLPILVDRVVAPRWAQDAKAAEEALLAAAARMPDRDACAEKLAGPMAQAPAAAKTSILKVLGAVGGAKALQAVGAAARQAETQDTATRLLGEWMTAEAAPVLLELAKSEADERYKLRALRGYLRIARQLEVPNKERIAMCREALPLCQRDNEKNLVIEVLRRYPAADGLPLVTAQLGNAELKVEASEAALSIAEKVLRSNPAAVATAMKQLVAAHGDQKVLDRAQGLLDRAEQRLSALAPPPPTLPIKVSANGRYFVDQKGNPFFWIGATQWQLFREYSLDEAKFILEQSHKNGFTVLQVMLMGVGDGTVPNVAGQKPWINDDPLTPNEAYFANVDRVVQAAHDNNILISMTVYHQKYRNAITVEKARPWAKWVAQRYKDTPNIVWSMTPRAAADFVPTIREIAAGLRAGDGGRHLITFKPDPSPYSSSFLHSESWLDFDSMQTWNGIRLIYPMVTYDYHLEPTKPVLMAEGAYEGSAKYGYEATPLWVRRQAYYSYLAGGHHTYGFSAASTNWETVPNWRKNLTAPGAVQMGVLKNFFLARPEWWLLVPDQSLFATGGRISRAPLPVQFATDQERSAYVRTLVPSGEGDENDGSLLHLAARHPDGKWAILYLADKAAFSVDTSKFKSAKLSLSWIDPVTGEATSAGEASNTGMKLLSTPEGWEDSLLLIEEAEATKAKAD